MTDQTSANAAESVSCPAALEPPIKRWLIPAIALLGVGVWCLNDAGTIKEPQEWSLKHANDVANYVFNHWGPYVFLPIGALLAIGGWLKAKKMLQADSEGIGYAGRIKTAWSKITKLDASRLSNGYLKLVFDDDNTLLLDSWRLKNFKEMVAFIETHVPEGILPAGKAPETPEADATEDQAGSGE